MRRFFILLSLSCALAACGIVYEQDVQQGNVLEQAQIDMLAPGMTRRQVRLVLGTPAITDPFHRDRWDYVAYQIPEHEDMEDLRQISLFFEGNKLVRIVGAMKPSGAEILGEEEIAEQIEEAAGDDAGEEAIGPDPRPLADPQSREETEPPVEGPSPPPGE